MDSAQAATTLASLRFAIGAGAWLTPNLSGRLFGLDPGHNPQLPYLGRLFGARDIALGAGTLQSSGDGRRQWLRIGVACDLADAVAGVLGARAGYLPATGAVLVTATALAAAGLGIAALQGEAAQPAA